MDIYTTKEICDKIPGVKPRMLIDLVEKGIIEPAKDSGGTGEHRLYSKENILEIMVAVSLRGMFPSYLLRAILENLKKIINKPIQFMIITDRNRSKKLPPAITFIDEGYDISKGILKKARDEASSNEMDTGPIYHVFGGKRKNRRPGAPQLLSGR